MSPFECQFGFTPPLFPDQEVEVGVPSTLHFVQCCQLTWRKARLKLLQTSQQYQHQANRRKRAAPALCPGQRVWLSTRNLPLCVESSKLTQCSIVYLVTYRLFLPRSLKINPTFHVSLLKPVVSSPFIPAVRPPPPPRIIGGQSAYMVHRILNSHRVRTSF